MKRAWSRMCLALCCATAWACGPRAGGGPDAGGDPGAAYAARYDEETLRLQAHRQPFGDEDMVGLMGDHQVVFWLEYPAMWDPTLHSADLETGRRTDHTIALDFDHLNVAVTDDAVAVAEVGISELTYRVFAADQRYQVLTTVTLPRPDSGLWPYALSGTELWFIQRVPVGGSVAHQVFRCPQGGTPEPVTTLETMGLAQPGDITLFMVRGNRVLLVENQRVWLGTLSPPRLRWLQHETQVSRAEFTDDGALILQADGPYLYNEAREELTALVPLLDSARRTLELGEVERYASGATAWGNVIVYNGYSGIFAYDRGSQTVSPVLLEPAMGRVSPVRVVYGAPLVLGNGTLLVTGLESESGAVGVEGPVYRVDLADVLSP